MQSFVVIWGVGTHLGSFLGGYRYAGLSTRAVRPFTKKKFHFGTSEMEVSHLSDLDGYKRVDEKVIVSTKEICKLFEISDRTLTDWKRQGLTQHSRGWWDLQHVLKWRGEIYNGDSEESKAVNLQNKKLEAEVALKEAQVELTQFKNALANGEYVERDKVRNELTRFFTVFKKSTLLLPKRLSGIISDYVEATEARRIERELHDTVLDALEQMSVEGVYNVRGKKKK